MINNKKTLLYSGFYHFNRVKIKESEKKDKYLVQKTKKAMKNEGDNDTNCR